MTELQEPSIARRQERANDDVCTACGSSDLTDFFDIDSMPVHVGIFGDSREEALSAPMGSIMLAWCPACGLVHNRRFDPTKLCYQPGYEVALHHSPTFRKFIEGVAARLIDRFELRNKTVLELGCGDGYFLRRLCDLGKNRGIGIDPTVPRAGKDAAGGSHVRFIREYFSERHADLEVDFVCSLSVFEHIPCPSDLLKTIRTMIGRRTVPVYFEVFNGFGAFAREDTWSVHYEQCNYFSKTSLAALFELAGFKVVDLATCYEGDQYLFVDALPDSEPRDKGQEVLANAGELPAELREFADNYRMKFNAWQERLDEFRRLGQRAVVWGSGGKGISFLNALNTADVIPYVVEINPDKHGKFIPGTGQEIVPPQFLSEYQPDKVIITNRLYEPEMKAQAEQLGVYCDFLIA